MRVLSMDLAGRSIPGRYITGSTITAVGPEREVTGAIAPAPADAAGRWAPDRRRHCHVTIHLSGSVPDDPG
jgi:hypothetical protein